MHKPVLTTRTSPQAWLVASCCAALWALVVLTGLAVLIAYLVLRPRSPHLDLPSVTLTAGDIGNGTLLTTDVTLLANFSNPNSNVEISFSDAGFDLYFKGALIGRQAVDGPFSASRGDSALRSVNMSGGVELPQKAADAWRQEVAAGEVAMQVTGAFRTTSVVGRFMHYSKRLRGQCNVVVGAPPNGALLSRQCRTR